MDEAWKSRAYTAAMQAAEEEPSRRRRWRLQAQWDRRNLKTESTRFPRELDEQLRRCCKEAGVTRYALIAYMLRAWMSAWRIYGKR